MAETESEARPVRDDFFLLTLYRTAIQDGKAEVLPLFFLPTVLERYRGKSGMQITRSNSAGRVSRRGSWSLDFGISPGDRFLHVSLQAFRDRLPASEHEHWLEHAVSLPVGGRFIQMQFAPGSCIDDGEIRDWS